MTHRWMKTPSEGEPQSDAVNLSLKLTGSDVDVDSENLQQVEAP